MEQVERGETVPGPGPEQERTVLKDFADWHRWNGEGPITTESIEKFLYDQYMLDND